MLVRTNSKSLFPFTPICLNCSSLYLPPCRHSYQTVLMALDKAAWGKLTETAHKKRRNGDNYFNPQFVIIRQQYRVAFIVVAIRRAVSDHALSMKRVKNKQRGPLWLPILPTGNKNCLLLCLLSANNLDQILIT